MANPDPYSVIAIRFAASPFRMRFHNCLNCAQGDPHDTPMPMDFYIWVIRNAHRTIVVDVGSKQWKCLQRGHEFIRCPVEGLEAVGVDPAKVDDLVITHLHWDHAGNIDRFPNARVHLQNDEMRYVVGPHMADHGVNHFYLVDDVKTVVGTLFEGRLSLHHGQTEIAPGVSLHRVGGHAAGMQIVRVYTQRGWVVLASDASHFYANIDDNNPFPIFANYPEVFSGWELCRALADSPDHIVPGHDPLVLRKYPPLSASLDGDAVRLDVDPVEERRA